METKTIDNETTDDKVSLIYDQSENTLKVCVNNEVFHQYITNEQRYNFVVESQYKWLFKDNIFPVDTQEFEINPSESLYLDTRWSAITSRHSSYPVLVTADICECVALAFINPKKIGMYHIYLEDANEKVTNFVKGFTKGENLDETKTILITGAISPNLSRCHEILQKNNINIIQLYYLKSVYSIHNERIFHPTLLNLNDPVTVANFQDDFMVTKRVDFLPSAMIAIDARTRHISLGFDIEEFKKEAGNCMEKALKARDAGMYIKFSHEDVS